MFYVNFYLSPNSGELETLVIGMRIIVNNFLFKNAFDTMLSGNISLMNSNWPDDFKVSFKDAKKLFLDTNSASTSFFPFHYISSVALWLV